MRSLLFRVVFILLLLTGFTLSAHAQTVYSGFDVSFSKVAFGDTADPANQDMITPGVIITRGNTRGIFNTAVEDSYQDFASPAGTTWAFGFNNPSETVAATNYAALSFTDWQSALGSGGSLLTSILEGPGVVHLVNEDIYLDIEFTAWGQGGGSGGSFSYNRAAIVPSNDNADFNNSGSVEGQDYLIWQENFGIGTTQATGDADNSGTVDGVDLGIWGTQYGSVAPFQAQSIPEPATGLLVLSSLLLSACGSRLLRR